SANVRAIDVSVRHEDDLVIPDVLYREFFLDACADRGDDRADFLVAEDLVDARSFDIQDFSAKRKNCLERTVASLLCRSAGRVSLDEIDLAESGVAQRAVSELARKIADV